jgi:hypothetical protein
MFEEVCTSSLCHSSGVNDLENSLRGLGSSVTLIVVLQRQQVLD